LVKLLALQAHLLAIGCGYPDGNDVNWLRLDPALHLKGAGTIVRLEVQSELNLF
jgi:hypothetical protein